MSLFDKKLDQTVIGTKRPVDSCVIFVHGFAGSIFTWTNFTNHLKRQWDLEDSYGIEFDQHTIEFNIPFVGGLINSIAGGPKIEVLANHFRTVVNEVCEEYDHVIIVAHSMGGLIARQYLVDLLKKQKNTGKIKALITYATPHKGSKLASWYRKLLLKYLLFPFYFSSNQVYQMCRSNSDFLCKLNDDWDKLRMNTKIEFRRVLGVRDWVVDYDSAALEGKDPDSDPIANKGHFNLINPKRAKDPAFMVTYNFLKKFKNNLEIRREKEELDALTEEETDEDD